MRSFKLFYILCSFAYGFHSHILSFVDYRTTHRIPYFHSTSNAQASLKHENVVLINSTQICKKLDGEFLRVAFPAFIGLVADPLASIVDAIYVGKLGPASQAGMGIAISAQYSVAKLYNDPLIKTSTSLVAGKSGEDLSASVSTAILTAVVIGFLQMFVYIFFSNFLMNWMGVNVISDMRQPAIDYLRWRAIGVPAATVLLVSNGIFRGRGDTKTPLFCTILGTAINIILDPILIFSLHMGCAGAGAATAISQWVSVLPQLYLLNKSIPFFSSEKSGLEVLQNAASSYFKAGSLVLIRTISKIAAYTITASAAARLGTVPMAAYSLTFNLGFATSNLCEAVSIAAQALLARDVPFTTVKKQISAAHIIRRALQSGLLASSVLTLATFINQKNVLLQMTKSPEVRAVAATVMPVVLLTQIFKSLAYSTNGVLMGGLDWGYSTVSVIIATLVCMGTVAVLPKSLWNIWVGLAGFMSFQVLVSSSRFLSRTGPWKDIDLRWRSKNVNPIVDIA